MWGHFPPVCVNPIGMFPMNTNPDHGYLTEPRWMQSRNTIKELIHWETWAEIASLASVIFVLWIVFS